MVVGRHHDSDSATGAAAAGDPVRWHTRGMRRRFRQVDVFTAEPYFGNPLAVVLDAEGLDAEAMQRFAAWTNLSETTFLLPPDGDGADYRVRIFTPESELPFAGHPTLGSCHAWLAAGGQPARAGEIVQQCGAGPVRIRPVGGNGGAAGGAHAGLAFAAPPLLRSGPVDEALTRRIAAMLRVDPGEVVAARWADNGPGWVAVLLASAAAVLALRPAAVDLDVGVAGPYPPGSPAAFEVRAFTPKIGGVGEDPVTGSLNAALGQWLLGSGRASAPYTVSQGTVLGRRGRLRVDADHDGTVWVGGATVTCIEGTVEL